MLKALLFDLDGTLVDTDRLHEQAWLELLLPYGIKGDHRYYQTQISGGLNPEIVARLLPQLSQAEALQFAEAKEARFRQMARELQPMPGLPVLWKWAIQQGLTRALVSNAPRLNADFLLGLLGLEFAVVVLGEDLSAAKPDPLPYQTALKRLGLRPEECVAFEDSPSGVRSAVGAGVRCVVLDSGHDVGQLEALGAFLSIRDFSDPRLWRWLETQVGS